MNKVELVIVIVFVVVPLVGCVVDGVRWLRRQ